MNWWESDPVSGGTAAVATPPQNNWWENDPATTATAPPQPQLTSAPSPQSPLPQQPPSQDEWYANLLRKDEARKQALRDSGVPEDQIESAMYQQNLQESAQMQEQMNPRGFVTGSLPYRTVEGLATNVAGKAARALGGVEAAVLNAVGADKLAAEAQLVRDQAQGNTQQNQATQALLDKKGWMGETLTSWFRQAGETVGESALAGAAGGLPALAGYFAGSEMDDRLAQGQSLTEAASHGLIEGAFTYLGGKYLGAGVEKMAAKLGGGAVGGLSSKIAKAISTKFPISEKVAEVAAESGVEVGEEYLTQLSHYFVDVANGRQKFSPQDMWENTKGVIGPSLLAGGGPGSISLAHDFTGKVYDYAKARLNATQKAVESEALLASKVDAGQPISRKDLENVGVSTKGTNVEQRKELAKQYVEQSRRESIPPEAAAAVDQGFAQPEAEQFLPPTAREAAFSEPPIQEPTNAVTQGQQQGDNQPQYTQDESGGLSDRRGDSGSAQQGGQVQEEVSPEVTPLAGRVPQGELVRETPEAERFTPKKTITTDDPNADFGHAGYVENGELVAFHITDNPESVIKALKSGKPLHQSRDEGLVGDIGSSGLYVSGVPQLWTGRAPNKFAVFENRTQETRKLIADKARETIDKQVHDRYIAAFEGENAKRWIKEYEDRGHPAPLSLLSDQPYNIKLWQQDWLDSLGLKQESPPKEVPVRLRGKFAEIDRQLSAEELSQLKAEGYDGAFFRGGFSNTGQLVVWNNDAVRSFGDYQNKKPAPGTSPAAPTPEGKVSNEIPEQAQGVLQEVQAQAEAQKANGQEGLLEQPPGQPTPVAPLTTDKSAAPTEALPDWVTEDQPIVPPAEADRPKATPKETAQVRRTIKGMLERGVVNEQEAELLRGMHPHDVQAMLNQARELSDGDFQYKQELRNEFNALFGTTGAKEQEVQQIITKDGKKRTRKVSAAGRKSAQARMIERNGGDPASIPGFDEAVQQLDIGLYPNLAGYASSLGNGDMEAGLFAILQGGAKQFETAEADAQFRDILDQYHAVQERESAGRAEDNRVAEARDALQGSAAEGGAVNEDFALSGQPKAEPVEFQNTATRQPNLIQDLQRDSLPGQQNIPGFDSPEVAEAVSDIESALGIAPPVEPGRAPERVLSADEQMVVAHLGLNFGVEVQPRGPQNEAEQWAVDTAAKLNRTVVFADGLPSTYNGNINPAFPNVIVIRSGANAVHSILAHELSHATGIDTIQTLAPELWEAAKQLRLNKASDAYRVRLVGDENGEGKQEGLLDREGVAEISGQFATDPKFREDMAKKHGKLYDVLRKSALKVIAKLLPKGGEFTVEGKKVVAKTARGRALEKVAQIELLQAFQKEFRRTAANVAKNGAMELSEDRPRQTRTPAFKRWFQGSKVVDENGEPLVVYHGTSGDFNEFDLGKAGSNTKARSTELGIFATDSPAVAGGFGESLMPLYAKLKKPLELGFTVFDKQGALDEYQTRDGFKALKNAIVSKSGKQSWDEVTPEDVAKWKQRLIDSGYDGLVLETRMDSREIVSTGKMRGYYKPHKMYVVFEPTQIKSATGNKGTFDPTNPNILLSEDKPDHWYAKSANIIEDKKFTKGSPGEVKKMLENGGVKPEELDWMGLSELLGPNTGKKTVTKEELLAAIKGGVQIQEVLKGNAPDKALQEWQNAADHQHRLDVRYENAFRDVEAALEEKGIVKPSDILSSNRFLLKPGTQLYNKAVEAGLKPQLDAYHEALNEWVSFELPQHPNQFQDAPEYNRPDLVLPGGDNYRELLLTLPSESGAISKDERLALEKEKRDLESAIASVNRLEDRGTAGPGARAERRDAEERIRKIERRMRGSKRDAYRSSHFDEPNILAHLRFNERTDADGKKVLFIEEIQSDWHEAGRKEGYLEGPGAPPQWNKWTVEKGDGVGRGAIAGQNEWIIRNEDGVIAVTKFAKTADEALQSAIQNSKDGWAEGRGRGLSKVPNAPFKKTWPLLAMKRAIQWAAENGFDRVAWTTGEQQNERYDLSKQVDFIQAEAVSEAEGVHFVDIKPVGEAQINLEVENGEVRDGSSDWIGKPLNEVIGKEMADKILSMESGKTQSFAGEDLRVGGSGMKGFYDDILPKEVNKFIKKFGAKVGKTEFDPLTKAQAFAEATVAGGKRTPYFDAHSFDITPEMRDSALKYGQPLFSEDKPFDRDKAREGLYKAITEAQSLTELRSRLKSVYGQDVPVDAIRKAVEKMRAKVRPELLADMEMAGARKAPAFPTGIKKAVVDAEREQLGLPPLPQSEGQKFEQWNESARATLDRNPDAGRQILNEVSQVDRSLTAREAAIITVHKAQLVNRQNDLAAQHIKAVEAGDTQAARELDDAQNIVSDQIQELNAIVRDANSEAGRSLVALKMMVNEDYTLAEMESVYRSANGGERLTPDQKQKIADMHAEIQRLKAELEQVKQQQVDKSINLGRKRVKGHEVSDADAAKSRFRQGLESLAKKLKLPFSGASIRLSEDADITGDLRQLADDAIGSGVTNFREFIDALESGVGSKLTEDYRSQLEKAWDAAAVAAEAVDKKFSPDDVRIDEDTTSVELATIAKKLSKYFDEHEGIQERRHNVEAVYNFLREFNPDITRQETMDAIADYGKVRELNKDPVEVRYRQRRGEIQAVRKLIDMLEGNPPKITGTEKESPGPTKRSIDRLVNNFKRALNIQPTDPAKQASSALSAAKRRIANHIYDLKQAIKAQAPLTRKRATNFGSDPEYVALKADLDQWQARYDEIFKKPELTDAQRIELAIKATERMTAEYGRRIQEGDFLTIRRDLPPSAALDAAKAKRDAVKSLYQELRALDPQYQAQELLKAARQRERRLTERADRLINRMQSGDFGPRHTSRMNWVPTQREAQIQAAIDGIVRAFNEEVGKARNIRRWTKDIEDIKQQIQTGVFATPSPRAEKVLSNEEQRLLVQRNALKQQRDIQIEEQNRSTLRRLWNNSTGLLRTVMTTGELSPVARQGGKALNASISGLMVGDTWNATAFANALYRTHRALFSQKYAAEQDSKIFNDPRLGKWSRAGLRITHQGEHIFGSEEIRVSSDIEKLPLIRNFSNAARVFFNTLRTESFEAMASIYGDAITPEQAQSIANMVNVSTGYAKLGRAEVAAGLANEVLFSARNLAASFQWLTGEPYRKADPTTKRLIAKQYAKTFIGLATASAIAALAGADIEKDPRSADFLKWRFGNTRIDPLMGLSQIMVFLAREVTGETKGGDKQVRYLRENYRPLNFFRSSASNASIKASRGTGADALYQFARSKFSPNLSLIVNFWAGKDVTGQPFSFESQGGNLIPMTYMDIYKEMREQGLPRGTAIAILAFYGYGLQTYEPKPQKQKVIY